MDSWNIIGWIVIFLFIGYPILKFIVNKIKEIRQWFSQKDLRKSPPRKYQTWKSIKTGQKYYINSDHYILVSVSANNNGGSSYTFDEWSKMVEREKLINI